MIAIAWKATAILIAALCAAGACAAARPPCVISSGPRPARRCSLLPLSSIAPPARAQPARRHPTLPAAAVTV